MYILCTVHVKEEKNTNNKKEKKNMWQTSERTNATNECASHRRTNSTAKSRFINRNVFVCASKCVIKLCAKTKWCYNNDKSQSHQRQRRLYSGGGGDDASQDETFKVSNKWAYTFTTATVSVDQRSLLAKLYEFHWMCALFSRMNIDRSYLIKRTFNIHWRKIARLFGFSCFKVRIPYIITHSFIVVAHYIEQWFNENIWASMHLHMHMLTRI